MFTGECLRSFETSTIKPFTEIVQGALPGLKQFLATESPLKYEKCFLFHLERSLCS